MHLATKGYNMSYCRRLIPLLPSRPRIWRSIAVSPGWQPRISPSGESTAALAYVECLGRRHAGVQARSFPFPKLLKLKLTESVVFGWGLFSKSRKPPRPSECSRPIKDKRLAKLDLAIRHEEE